MRRLRTHGGVRRGDAASAAASDMAIARASGVTEIAVFGDDYPGLRLSLQVNSGDTVRAGQTLMHDRSDARVRIVAPLDGTVSAITRGARRRIAALRLRVAADAHWERPYALEQMPTDADDTMTLLLDSGLWPALRERPFDRIARPGRRPQWLFVTAIDTHAGALPVGAFIERHAEAFFAGLVALAALPHRQTFVCRSADVPAIDIPHPAVEDVLIDGPHPAGLPGTHVSLLAAVDADATAWHIGYQEVAAVGRLLCEQRVGAAREIAVPAEQTGAPRAMLAPLGARIDDLLADHPRPATTLASGPEIQPHSRPAEYRHLRRHHVQVHRVSTAAPHANNARWRHALQWLRARQPSPVVSLQSQPDGLLPLPLFDRVWPLRTPVIPLLRALLAGDEARATEFGLLGLADEDFALCAAVCPSGLDYPAACRSVLQTLAEP